MDIANFNLTEAGGGGGGEAQTVDRRHSLVIW